MQIYYIVEKIKNIPIFHFFEKYTDAKKKEDELGAQVGKEKLYDTFVNPFPIQYKTLKKYYGTVWLSIKRKEGAFSIHGSKKDADRNIENGYSTERYILTPYKEYINRFKEEEEEEPSHSSIKTPFF